MLYNCVAVYRAKLEDLDQRETKVYQDLEVFQDHQGPRTMSQMEEMKLDPCHCHLWLVIHNFLNL